MIETQKLTEKQRKAVAYRLAGETQINAFLLAGYSDKGKAETLKKAATRLFSMPHIQKALGTAEKVASIEVDILTCEEAAHSRKVRCIQGLEKIAFPSDEDTPEPVQARLKAIETIMKYSGMLTEKVEHSAVGAFTFTIIKPEREKADGL